jgi:hypothetical protein
VASSCKYGLPSASTDGSEFLDELRKHYQFLKMTSAQWTQWRYLPGSLDSFMTIPVRLMKTKTQDVLRQITKQPPPH